jgi:UDP-glucose 4-epimerase
MKIFITGGTGNIGQYVTKRLWEAGHEIVLFTRTPNRIPYLKKLERVNLVKGELTDLKALENGLQGCGCIIHIALSEFIGDPLTVIDNETRVTAFLLGAAERAGAESFIYTSSTAAMGSVKDGADESSICKPYELYGAAKAASEMYVLGFRQYFSGYGYNAKKVNMRRNIIRPGIVFSNPAFEGGASENSGAFSDIARAALLNEEIVITEEAGSQLISAPQLAQIYQKLIESDLNEEIFLGKGSRFIKWTEIAKMALDLIPESASKITEIKEQGLKPVMYNVGKLERVFGLSFDASADAREHMRWAIERERSIINGAAADNIYHK